MRRTVAWYVGTRSSSLFTVIVEIFQMYDVGSVAKVDESLTVRPALNNDAT